MRRQGLGVGDSRAEDVWYFPAEHSIEYRLQTVATRSPDEEGSNVAGKQQQQSQGAQKGSESPRLPTVTSTALMLCRSVVQT